MKNKDNLDAGNSPEASQKNQGEQKPEETPKENILPSENPSETQQQQEKDWKIEAEKWRVTAENYKKENLKYRKGELSEKKEVKKEEEGKDFWNIDSPAPYEEQKAIEMSFKKDKQDIIDSVVSEFSEKCSDAEWDKFKSVFPSVNLHLAEALKKGEFVSRKKLENAVKEYIAFAKGTNVQDYEKAKAEGAMEALRAEQADIGRISSNTRKSTGSSVTAKDKEIAEKTGGFLTSEEIKEIREKRESRLKEYEPRIMSNEIP